MIGAPKHVKKALDAGVDIICAQGGEGERGSRHPPPPQHFPFLPPGSRLVLHLCASLQFLYPRKISMVHSAAGGLARAACIITIVAIIAITIVAIVYARS